MTQATGAQGRRAFEKPILAVKNEMHCSVAEMHGNASLVHVQYSLPGAFACRTQVQCNGAGWKRRARLEELAGCTTQCTTGKETIPNPGSRVFIFFCQRCQIFYFYWKIHL